MLPLRRPRARHPHGLAEFARNIPAPIFLLTPAVPMPGTSLTGGGDIVGTPAGIAYYCGVGDSPFTLTNPTAVGNLARMTTRYTISFEIAMTDLAFNGGVFGFARVPSGNTFSVFFRSASGGDLCVNYAIDSGDQAGSSGVVYLTVWTRLRCGPLPATGARESFIRTGLL